MQSMPLLLRQSLKSPGLSAFSRTTTTTAAANPPITARLRISSAAPNALSAVRARRQFSSCRRCQFRLEHGLYSAHDIESGRNHGKDGHPPGGETTGTTAKDIPQEGDVPNPDEAGNAGDPSTGGVNAENVQTQQDVGRNNKEVNGNGNNGGGGGGGGLPSYMENRRSRYSKQFSFMMDNLQSNIFVAGQRLNDLTGYSSIEALKREIQNQEDRLRAARRNVREAKENYTAAINRRSTSQREVNELLQRKHAWSSTDLERFTHLYRNDHTNEVAENEAQMSLSMAEREAEEAATKLSKNILSRYHEEQVWSDKIRRMSTWGTWGLMGVNVLLFLVFQIGVEPWRRKRLVKGFEEKVMEALEKEKVSTQEQSAAAAAAAVATATPPSEQASLESSTSDATTSDQATSIDDQNIIEYRKSSFSHITPPSTSVESWRQTLNDLLTESTLFIITQRDLTTVAMQSAAAGAAVMGLVIAVIRPR